MEEEAIKILLANDHALMRWAIKDVLHKTSNIRVIEEAVSFPDLFIKLEQCQPDILMTDDIMPDGSCVKDLPVIKDRYPNLKIIVTTIHTDRAYLNSWIAFCDGILNNSAPVENFIIAVETVHNEGFYFFNPGFKKRKDKRQP